MVNQSIEVIPGIFENDPQAVQQKIALVASLVKWVQIDIADGKLVPNMRAITPEQLKPLIVSPIQCELHMMVAHPFEVATSWIDAGVKRLIIHAEALDKEHVDHKIVATKIVVLQEKVEVGLAINAETPISAIEKYLDIIDCVLVMTIKAGFSGQTFMPSLIKKIQQLHVVRPYVPIEVDGGINEQTAALAVKAGATRLVSTSFLFNSPNIEKAIWTLTNLPN